MKKIYVITAIILLMATLLTLVSCKEDTPDPSTDSSTESSTPIEDSSVDESLDLSMDDSSVEEGSVDDSSTEDSSTEDITSDIPEDSSEEESNPEESIPEESAPEESNPSEDVSEESIPSESSEEVSEEPEVSEEEPKECVHSYKTSVVKATCKAGGYTLHKCEKCGEEYKTDKTEKSEHQFGEMWTGLLNNILVVQCKACGAEPLSNAKCEHRFVVMEWYNEEYDCPVYYLCEVCGKIENRYDCGNPVHKQYKTCDNPSEHANYVSKEEKGCRHCGEHDCLCIYTNKSEDCPKYDPMKDDRVICQKCGKERGIGLGKCTTLLMDGNCIHCDAFIKAGECHECPYELKTEYYYFDANGGDLNGFPEMIEGKEGKTTAVIGYPIPVREGYVFLGWDEKSVVSAEELELFATLVDIQGLPGSVYPAGTWYAVWMKK